MMELERYNPKTLKTTRIGKPLVRFAKSGQIKFSKIASNEIPLKGRYIQFCHDKKRPSDWYIYITDDPAEGFHSRVYKECVIINQSVICYKLIKQFAEPGAKSIGFPVSIEPIEKDLYAIITKQPLK